MIIIFNFVMGQIEPSDVQELSRRPYYIHPGFR